MAGRAVSILKSDYKSIEFSKHYTDLNSTEIGCFIGAVTTSFIGEGLGRRRSVLIGVIILIIGLCSVHFIETFLG